MQEAEIKNVQPPFCKANVSGSACSFELGEIVVFESYFRFEVYISRIMKIHIDNWGSGWLPVIRKATTEEKQRWFECGEHELVIADLHCH